MKLNPGIRGHNFVASICVMGYFIFGLNVTNSFITFLMRDPHYYNVDKDKVASDLGNIMTAV